MQRTVTLLLVLSAALATAPKAQSQGQGQALSPGQVTITSAKPYPCTQARNGSKFLANMTCQDAKITGCNNVDQIALTFGYIGPSKPQGTVVFLTGGTGETPESNEDDVTDYATTYQNYFEVVYLEWNSPWEKPLQSSDPLTGGGNILQAACRPATFLGWINGPDSGLHQTGAMCAQGSSAGSAALAYSMSWYGAGSYLTNAEFLSGPVLSEIDQGCSTADSAITICGAGTTYCSPKTTSWTDPEIYTPNDQTSINNWSGLSGCGQSSGNGNLETWENMSIVDGSISGATPTFYFKTVAKHGWLCASSQASTCSAPDCPNNSAAEGSFFYNAITDTNLLVTGITSCAGAEGVAQGTDPDSGKSGSSAIETDMLNNCH